MAWNEVSRIIVDERLRIEWMEVRAIVFCESTTVAREVSLAMQEIIFSRFNGSPSIAAAQSAMNTSTTSPFLMK